jgi:hypothetical protein
MENYEGGGMTMVKTETAAPRSMKLLSLCVQAYQLISDEVRLVDVDVDEVSDVWLREAKQWLTDTSEVLNDCGVPLEAVK